MRKIPFILCKFDNVKIRRMSQKKIYLINSVFFTYPIGLFFKQFFICDVAFAISIAYCGASHHFIGHIFHYLPIYIITYIISAKRLTLK